MPEFDPERLEIADGIRRQLAIENELSRSQARSFVRCLQTSWQVQTIQWTERDSNRQLSDARRLLQAAHIFREIEGPRSRRAIDCYRRAGEILEWLARAADDSRRQVPIELLAAGAYQLGGLPAMAAGLMAQITTEHEGVALYGAFLRADFDGVLRRAANYWSANPNLTVPAAGRFLAAAEDREDIERVGRYFTVELIRSLGLVADSLRRGDDARLARAMDKLQALERMAMRILSDDASLIISLLYQVAESYRKASIYGAVRSLANLNPERQGRLLAYARDQFSRGRGVLWTSQLQGIDRLRQESSFALCTPTGSGKTLIANLALVRELMLREADGLPPLAMYLVPSRALAGEVEAKLRSELGRDMTVTALYGGADWGITDAWLTGDQPTVLIATVEKADALMRYLGPILAARLRLMIVDEAHQVVPEANENTRVSFSEHSNRAIRLEQLVSRVLVQRPNVVRIALTAVAGGAAGPVAKWIEGRADATAVGVRYRSTRQVIGVLETAPGAQGRILLDIMNGRPLYIRGQEQPVYLPLRMPPMPGIPARMRNSLNRFNCLSVLWTALHLVEEDQRILISVAQEPEQTMRWFQEALLLPAWANAPQFQAPEGFLREDGLHLAFPIIYDPEKGACIRYKGFRSKLVFPDLDLSGYLGALQEQGVTSFTADDLRKHAVHEVDDEGKDCGKSWKIGECLVLEAEVDGHTYVLSGGRWYQVAQDYAQELVKFFDELPREELPDALPDENEEKYNRRLKNDVPELLCLDRKLIKPTGWTTSIEACDFLDKNARVIHVKDKTSSSRLSHLFNQGTVSGRVLIGDAAARDLLRGRIDEVQADTGQTGFADVIPSANESFQPRDYTIVYAVIGTGDDAKLPFFSLVTLRQAVRELIVMGYKAAFAWIKKPAAAGTKPAKKLAEDQDDGEVIETDGEAA